MTIIDPHSGLDIPSAAPKRPSSDRSGRTFSVTDHVYREVLPNGATLLLKQTAFSPVVAITTYFKVGYFHEADHESGLAHLMEHMFFKGSKHHPGPDDVSISIERLGGSLNAGTIYDRTFYYFVMPKDAFRPALELMADACVNPVLDAEEMRKEIEVVIEESNRKRDNPGAMATEGLFAMAYDVHRMRRWRIGSDPVLRAMTRELALDFHRRLYRPEHMVISIVGDFDLDEARPLAIQAFSAMERGAPHKELSPPEPPQAGLKVGAQKAAIQFGHLELGIKGLDSQHPDLGRMGLLMHILGQGRSSRLYRALKLDQSLVRSIGASAIAYEGVGLIHVGATFEPVHLPEIRRRIWIELERVRHAGISERELRVAKQKIEAGRLFQLEEVREQAVSIAWFEAHGGLHLSEENLERLRTCTREDLQALARQYLGPEHATLFYYLPNGAEDPEIQPSVIHDEWMQARSLFTPPEARLSPHSRPFGMLRPPRLLLPDLKVPRKRRLSPTRHHRTVELPLLTGGHLIVLENPELPIVALGTYFRGGRHEESIEQVGTTRLSLLGVRNGGTRQWHPDMFANALGALGAGLDPLQDSEYLGYKLQLPADKLGSGLTMLQDLLIHPLMDAERLEVERKSLLNELKAARDQTARSAMDLLMQAAFGDEHPFGIPDEGRESVLRNLNRHQLLEWHQLHLSRMHRLVVAAGDVDATSLRDALDEQFSALPLDREITAAPAWNGIQGIQERVEQREKQQTALALAFQAPSPTDPDYPALLVMLAVLSSSSGRLKAELRGRQSLAYAVAASELGLSQHNLLLCTIACEASKEQAARRGMLEELDRMCQTLISDEELERARTLLVGRRATGSQTLSARVARLAWAQFRGLGVAGYEKQPARVKAVEREDVLRVARSVLLPDRYAIGIARGRGKS